MIERLGTSIDKECHDRSGSAIYVLCSHAISGWSHISGTKRGEKSKSHDGYSRHGRRMYCSAKVWTINSISGLWLPWGLPYLGTNPSACPAQGSKDINNDSHPGRRSSRSSRRKNCHVFSCVVQSRSSIKTHCSSVAGNKLDVGIEESLSLAFSGRKT